MDVSTLLNQLGNAVADATAKKEAVEKKKSALAAYVASKQTDIDEAQQSYDDAAVAVARLQDEARSVIGSILPQPDPRFRVSK